VAEGPVADQGVLLVQGVVQPGGPSTDGRDGVGLVIVSVELGQDRVADDPFGVVGIEFQLDTPALH
jgi:hypothetical protein